MKELESHEWSPVTHVLQSDNVAWPVRQLFMMATQAPS